MPRLGNDNERSFGWWNIHDISDLVERCETSVAVPPRDLHWRQADKTAYMARQAWLGFTGRTRRLEWNGYGRRGMMLGPRDQERQGERTHARGA